MVSLKTMPPLAISALAQAPAEQLVRVYTAQHPDAWALAQQRGYLTGSPEKASEDWQYPYDWMRSRMAERVPGYTGDYPVWAYLRRNSARKNRSRISGHLGGLVRVSALVPRGRLVLSCYDSWHYVLNNWYFAHTAEQGEAFDAEYPLHKYPGECEGYQRTVEASWGPVLDVERVPVSDYVDRARVLQACVDRIYMGEVCRVREPSRRELARGERNAG